MRLYTSGEMVRYIGHKWYKEGEILKVIGDVGEGHMTVKVDLPHGGKDFWVDRSELEPIENDILKGMSDTMNRQRLQLLIDEALDSGDRDKFIEYSGMLKELLVHA